MGADCSNCKCTNGEEEKILVIPELERHQIKEARRQKLEQDKATVSKSKKSLNKEILQEILDYNPGLEKKIVKVQSLIRTYKARTLYKNVLKKLSENQLYFTSDELFETLSRNAYKDLIKHNTEFRYQTGAVYSGEWLGGFRNGFGKMTWPDGTYYEGMWSFGFAEGEGFYLNANGTYMRGEFRYNKLNGRGECFNKEISYKYIGMWINDLQNGQGTETWTDGAEYLGIFENGNKEKFGKYCWSDSSYYIGEWKDNKINGYVSSNFNFLGCLLLVRWP